MGRDMAQREPHPGREYAMNGVIVLSRQVPWVRSRGCYAQRRRMLWTERPPLVMVVGRRDLPPITIEVWTQP
jgi:hypothetical protein